MAISDVMESIESDYESLRGILSKAEYQDLDNTVLGQLLRTLNPEELKRASGDVFGRVYEYLEPPGWPFKRQPPLPRLRYSGGAQMGDPAMVLGDAELQRKGEYVKGNLKEWLEDVEPARPPDPVTNTMLMERIIRTDDRFCRRGPAF